MLIDFTVGNYRSIRDPQTLTMVAAPRDRQHEVTHVLVAPDGTRLLRTALVYGPNGSGKSTLLDAIDTLVWLVSSARGFDETTTLDPLDPFRLDGETRDQPCVFEISFVAAEVVYEYALSATRERIVSESLRYYPKGHPRTLFTREGDSIALVGNLDRSTARMAKKISERRSNTPFLSILGQNEEPDAIEAYRWFLGRLATTVSPSLTDMYTKKLLADDPDAKRFILDVLRLADTGITGADARREFVDVPEEVRRAFAQHAGAPQGAKAIPAQAETIRVQFQHHGVELVEFDEEDESMGTRQLLALAGPLYDVFQNGRVLVIDELDSSLHPDLVSALVDLFNRPDFNRHGAQLVANTHDVTQLDLSRIRRDGVWFTEKGADGATTLTCLADVEGVRADTALQKNYLQGRFGALPAHGLSLLTVPDPADGPHS